MWGGTLRGCNVVGSCRALILTKQQLNIMCELPSSTGGVQHPGDCHRLLTCLCSAHLPHPPASTALQSSSLHQLPTAFLLLSLGLCHPPA